MARETEDMRSLKELLAAWMKNAPEERKHQFKMRLITAIVVLSVSILSVYLAGIGTVGGDAIIGLFGTLFGYWLRGA